MKLQYFIFVILTAYQADNCYTMDKLPQPRLLPKDYVNINGSSYYFSPPGIPYTAVQAAQTCNDAGMKLLSLQTPEKEEIINNYMAENGIPDFPRWTSGARYAFDQWIWTGTGELINTYNNNYTNFEVGQPDEVYEACIYFWNSSPWRDWKCDDVSGQTPIAFICEY